MATPKKPAGDSLQVLNLKRQLADEKAMRRLAEEERDQWRTMVVDAETAILVQSRLLNGARTVRPGEDIPF